MQGANEFSLRFVAPVARLGFQASKLMGGAHEFYICVEGLKCEKLRSKTHGACGRARAIDDCVPDLLWCDYRGNRFSCDCLPTVSLDPVGPEWALTDDGR